MRPIVLGCHSGRGGKEKTTLGPVFRRFAREGWLFRDQDGENEQETGGRGSGIESLKRGDLRFCGPRGREKRNGGLAIGLFSFFHGARGAAGFFPEGFFGFSSPLFFFPSFFGWCFRCDRGCKEPFLWHPFFLRGLACFFGFGFGFGVFWLVSLFSGFSFVFGFLRFGSARKPKKQKEKKRKKKKTTERMGTGVEFCTVARCVPVACFFGLARLVFRSFGFFFFLFFFPSWGEKLRLEPDRLAPSGRGRKAVCRSAPGLGLAKKGRRKREKGDRGGKTGTDGTEPEKGPKERKKTNP